MTQYLLQNLPEYLVDIIIVVGSIYTIILLKSILSLVINVLNAVVLITSATYVFTVSAHQKLIHNQCEFSTLDIALGALQFIFNNFTSFIVAVDSKVEFTSDDFYWGGLFNYKTYKQMKNLV